MAITMKKCQWCKTEFLGTAKAVFCSGKCRTANYRKAKKNENNK